MDRPWSNFVVGNLEQLDRSIDLVAVNKQTQTHTVSFLIFACITYSTHMSIFIQLTAKANGGSLHPST